jgi:hypothetical protein
MTIPFASDNFDIIREALYIDLFRRRSLIRRLDKRLDLCRQKRSSLRLVVIVLRINLRYQLPSNFLYPAFINFLQVLIACPILRVEVVTRLVGYCG